MKRDSVDLTQDSDDDIKSVIDLTHEDFDPAKKKAKKTLWELVSMNIDGKWNALTAELKRADVLCVQETKTTTAVAVDLGGGPTFATSNVFVDAAGRRNANRGVATFSRDTSEAIDVPSDGRMVVTQFFSGEKGVTVVNIYGCTTGKLFASTRLSGAQRDEHLKKQKAMKLEFEARVVDTVRKLLRLEKNNHVVLLGDFNQTAKNGASFFSELAKLGMVDAQTVQLPDKKPDFDVTYVNGDISTIRARVDYIFLSRDLSRCVESCEVLRDIAGVSDHFPLRIRLDLSRLEA